jgi:hypothetical protein
MACGLIKAKYDNSVGFRSTLHNSEGCLIFRHAKDRGDLFFSFIVFGSGGAATAVFGLYGVLESGLVGESGGSGAVWRGWGGRCGGDDSLAAAGCESGAEKDYRAGFGDWSAREECCGAVGHKGGWRYCFRAGVGEGDLFYLLSALSE